MIPRGTLVLIRRPAGGWESDNGRLNANRQGYVTNCFPSIFQDNNICHLDMNDNSIFVYENELQVLELPISLSVIGGEVVIGDRVAWPQRTGSRMWMVHGHIVNITKIIQSVSPIPNIQYGFQIDKSVFKITIIQDGKRHSTTNIERVVKICPTST